MARRFNVEKLEFLSVNRDFLLNYDTEFSFIVSYRESENRYQNEKHKKFLLVSEYEDEFNSLEFKDSLDKFNQKFLYGDTFINNEHLILLIVWMKSESAYVNDIYNLYKMFLEIKTVKFIKNFQEAVNFLKGRCQNCIYKSIYVTRNRKITNTQIETINSVEQNDSSTEQSGDGYFRIKSLIEEEVLEYVHKFEDYLKEIYVSIVSKRISIDFFFKY